MTWGVQNDEAEAHEQLDYAVKERGVNFIDTAEMYPVPNFDPQWCPGTTEEYIGNWLHKNPDLRDKVVLATKVVGRWPKSRVAARRTLPEGEADDYPDGRLDEKISLGGLRCVAPKIEDRLYRPLSGSLARSICPYLRRHRVQSRKRTRSRAN